MDGRYISLGPGCQGPFASFPLHEKLIALGINAAASDERAMKKQMMSAMKEFDITRDEIVDVLRVVLLTSGMPPFTKAMKILYELTE